jgi:hypothetical protein
LSDKNVINNYLLAINGIPIHMASDISEVIEDLLDRKPETAHCTLTGFNFLFGTLTDENQHDDLLIQAPDHATSRVVMAIALMDDEAPLDAATIRSCEAFPEYFQDVSSIHPANMETRPSSFRKAMHKIQSTERNGENLFSGIWPPATPWERMAVPPFHHLVRLFYHQ